MAESRPLTAPPRRRREPPVYAQHQVNEEEHRVRVFESKLFMPRSRCVRFLPICSHGPRRIVQTMIRTPPFSFWPLHVKLFTEEASDIWQSTIARNTASSNLSPADYFPPGFSWSIELEGVDGRSGHPQGSGRTAPLDVKDGPFSPSLLG
jgi:hypothetical protein